MHSLTGWLEQPSDAGVNFFTGTRWERRTNTEFAGQVLDAAAHLRAHGVRRRDRVALALPSGPAFARYFFGAVAIGATPTPIAPPGYQGPGDYAGFARSRLATLKPSIVVTDPATIAQMAPAGPWRYLDTSEPAPTGGTDLLDPLAPDDLALIQFTSGSTSAPRGVTLTSAAVTAQIDLLARVANLRPGDDSFSSWLPLHHDMGLIGLFVTPVTIGAELWLMRPEHFVRRPIDWLATFGRHGARRSATPCFGLAQLARRIAPEQLAGMDFSGWESLIVGADRVSYETLEAVYKLLGPHGLRAGTMTPAYGMAEATLAVVAVEHAVPPSAVVLESVDFSSGAAVTVVAERHLDQPTDPVGPAVDRAGHSVVSCGPEPDGVRVTVVDDECRPLPDCHVGELMVRSPALSHGYLGDPVENGRFTDSGYLTGDLGFRRDGDIYVLGRVGDSVKVNGRFVTAEDMELALARALSVPQDRVAVVLRDVGDGATALLAVQQRVDEFDPSRVADVVAAFGLDPARFCVIGVARRAVPRTTSGKPRRGQLWREVESGALTGDVFYLGAEFPFRFGAGAPEDGEPGVPAPLRTDLGGKGFGLTVMQSEHLPVPPFVVLGAGELAAGGDDAAALRKRLSGLVSAASAAFGAPESTIGLAVRSSPPRSMPGMMDTLLGLGLRPDDLEPLARRLGGLGAAWETLLGQAVHLCRHVAGAGDDQVRAANRPDQPHARRWELLTALYTDLTGQPYPLGRAAQAAPAVQAVRDSWQSPRAQRYRAANGIPDQPGPAVVIQAMAYGAAAGESGSGVVFSHNPLNGEPGLFGEFLPAATGEALVSGTRTPRPVAALRDRAPELYEQLRARVEQLYRVLRAMVDVEFVIENGRLWLVQVRPATAPPHVLNRVCASAWRDGLLTDREALLRLEVDALFAPMPASARPGDDVQPLAVGLPACPGVHRGPVATSVEEILTYPPGEAVLLRPTTEPSDFPGMMHAGALVTLEGGNTSHAAVVARELNIPAVVALGTEPSWDGPALATLARFGPADGAARFGPADGAAARLPAEVTVCGTTGRVFAGAQPITEPAVPPRPDALLAPWRADLPKWDLPECDLDAAVLAGPEQIEHARWTLAQRAARALPEEDA